GSAWDVGVADAAGSGVTLAGLRGRARAVAVYFMRTGTCPVCIQHARALARLDLPAHGVQPVVVVPGPPAHAARSGASPATGSPSCPPAAPGRTWPRDCTGPCSLNTVASCSPTR